MYGIPFIFNIVYIKYLLMQPEPEIAADGDKEKDDRAKSVKVFYDE